MSFATGVNWNLILKYMLVLAGLIIWEIMFNYWNVMRYYQTQANLVFYINYYVLKHIKRIRLSFFDDKDPAYLNQRVNEDINSIVNYKLDLICNMSISVLSFITIIGILSRVTKTLIYNPDIYIELNEVIRNKIFKVHTFKISHLYFFIALFTSRLSLLLFKITSTTPMTRNYPSYLKYCDFLTDFHFL